jgi:predicted metal-binding membrane protein
MNVLWIAAISAFVLIEKIVPVGRLISDSRSRLCRGWDLACGWVVMNGTATLLFGATSARSGNKPSASYLGGPMTPLHWGL